MEETSASGLTAFFVALGFPGDFPLERPRGEDGIVERGQVDVSYK